MPKTPVVRTGAWLAVCYALALAASAMADVAAHPDWRNALAPQGRPGPELTLSRDGQACCRIVVPRAPTTQDEKAAADLVLWLGKMTGAQFTIIREGAQAPAGTVVSIGRTDLLAAAGLAEARADLGDEGYAIAAGADRLYLLGGRQRGAINAVYALLEEDLGCRWYALDSVTVPQRATLRFRPVPRVSLPALPARRDPLYADAINSEWSLHNRSKALGAAIPPEWGGYPKPGIGTVHTYDALVPPATYFATHPEYFGMIAGERKPLQLCLSNTEVLALVTGKVLAYLREHPDTRIVDVSPNDRRDYCECPDCLAQVKREGGTQMATLLPFVNSIAEAVAREFPEVNITTLAYLDTVAPPKTILPRSNVLFWLCTDSHAWAYPCRPVWTTPTFQSALKRWEAVGANTVIWDYPIDYSHYMSPLPNLRVVSDNMRFFIRHGAKGIMEQAQHNTNRAVDRCLERSWVWTKQMWDPSRDTDALLHDFYFGYFGKAAEPMWAYEQLLKDAEMRLQRTPLATDYRTVLTPEFTTRSWRLFLQARRAARGDEELTRRVERAKLPLLYLLAGRGPGEDVKAYVRLLDEFGRIAHRENALWIENAFGAPDLDPRLAYWRELATVDPAKLDFVPLSNAWRFKPDPGTRGITDSWFAPTVDDSAWATVRSDTGTGWESQGFKEYIGYGWYRQQFAAPAELAGKPNLRLLFGAVDEDCEIWINGQRAYDHTFATTGLVPEQIWQAPFALDVAPFMRPGQPNLIAIRIKNTVGMGGVWQPAYLVWGDAAVSPVAAVEVIRRKSAAKPR